MSKQIQAIRGMNDTLPEDIPYWHKVEDNARQLLEMYGYSEIRMPIVEQTELFKRSIGEVTDIVEKEMYTFTDRNGDNLTLRPEGTAGCVRAVMQNGLLHNQIQRLWYRGPMFRHERPQKGRYRQFQQIGVEVFGLDGPDIDAELILMTARLWKMLGLESAVTLQINSLGSSASRAAYRQTLIEYLSAHPEQLDEDSQRRLHSNPLRILDSKNLQMADLIANAPLLKDSLEPECREHFKRLTEILDLAGLSYQVNPFLVRGLDYYNRSVFEWVTDQLGSQGTVCAGGRYDGLVEQLGGKPKTAVGFAMGIERLVAMLQQLQIQGSEKAPHLYLIQVGAEAEKEGMVVAERLRDQLPNVRLLRHAGGGSFKNQFKKADKSGAQYALILGDEEIANQSIGLKPLRNQGEQQSLSLDNAANFIRNILN